jgi:hypothetical protein
MILSEILFVGVGMCWNMGNLRGGTVMLARGQSGRNVSWGCMRLSINKSSIYPSSIAKHKIVMPNSITSIHP